MPTVIESAFADVTPFIDEVIARADSDKDALGFLPQTIYPEAAHQGKLLVATIQGDNTEEYAGHLLFGGVYPQARIFQLYVAPAYRGRGIARDLLSFLTARLSEKCWLSVTAKVAADLSANKVWEKLGFVTVRVKPGGFKQVVVGHPGKIWSRYGMATAISKKEFDKYFNDADSGCAIIFDSIHSIKNIASLADIRRKFKSFHPPQFFKSLAYDSAELRYFENLHRFPIRQAA